MSLSQILLIWIRLGEHLDAFKLPNLKFLNFRVVIHHLQRLVHYLIMEVILFQFQRNFCEEKGTDVPLPQLLAEVSQKQICQIPFKVHIKWLTWVTLVQDTLVCHKLHKAAPWAGAPWQSQSRWAWRWGRRRAGCSPAWCPGAPHRACGSTAALQPPGSRNSNLYNRGFFIILFFAFTPGVWFF